jgi:hypothetical protein
MKREFNFTLEGRIIAMYLRILMNDSEFSIDKPIIDNYLFDVGREMDLSQEQTQLLINLLIEKGILN